MIALLVSEWIIIMISEHYFVSNLVDSMVVLVSHSADHFIP